MPRFKKLLAVILTAGNLATAGAGDLKSDLQTFLTAPPSKQQIVDIFKRL